MKKRTLFRSFALLLAMLMLLSAAVTVIGAEEPPKSNDTQTAMESNAENSEDKVLRDDCWYIAYKNTTTYSLVRSKNAMNLVKAKLLEVQENFKKWTAADPKAAIDKETDHELGAAAGADFEVITNASQLTNQEIIIGQVGSIGRQEIEDRAKELGLGAADFFIEVKEDGDVWIVGGANTSTAVAVEFCINRVFDLNIEERYICVKKGYFYVYHHAPEVAPPSSVISNQGKTELEFVVSPSTMDDVFARLTYAKLGGWRIQNKYSITEDYNDYGASQMVSLAMGELPDVSVETLSYETLEDGSVKVIAPDGSYAILCVEPFSLAFYTKSGVLAQTVTGMTYAGGGTAKTGKTATVTLAIGESEPIYGGGQRFDGANLNTEKTDKDGKPVYGQKLVLYATDIWDNPNHTDSNEQMQIVVPFFTRLNGAGVFMNRNEFMVADIASTKRTEMTLSATEGLIDCYVFPTESIADSIGKYCEVSGANAMPEEWAYGMITCRAYPDFSNLDKVYPIIAKMEEYSLPWTGITVQGWSAYIDETHEELKELCDYVHSLGKKVMVSVAVGDFPGAEEMDAAIRAESLLPAEQKPSVPALDYFMEYTSSKGNKHCYEILNMGTDAATRVFDKKIPNCDPDALYLGLFDSSELFNNGFQGEKAPKWSLDTNLKASYYLDITNPEAVDWFFNDYWGYLTDDVGVDGVKIDGGFRLPDTAGSLSKIYDTQMPLAGMHHWYPTAFSAMIWEQVASKPDSGVCFIRGGGIGAQRLSYVAIADQTRSASLLQRQVTAMLSAGLSGIAFTTFDIGGSVLKNGKIAIEADAPIFLRSLEVAAFSTSMQAAGSTTRQPYDYAEYEDENGDHPFAYVTELYKIYTMVHEALTPYLNEQSEIACETGMPVVRHLVLQFSGDAKVCDIQDQYMLGDAFLVAPVLPSEIKEKDNPNTKREIYLPEGEWIDLLSGETVIAPAGGLNYAKYSATGSLSQGQTPVFYNPNSTSEVAHEIYVEIQELLAMASAVTTP